MFICVLHRWSCCFFSLFFFSSRRRHTRWPRDWSSDVCSSDLRYVDLFDRGRTTSLNLFEHVHGDGRQRGDAMLELRERYHRIGLEQSDYELPDHLPVMLEYLSCCEPDETPELLRECSLILRKLGNTLAKRNSRYAAVLAALLELAGEKGLDPSEPVPPPEDLDESWEERPAFEIPADTQS